MDFYLQDRRRVYERCQRIDAGHASVLSDVE